MNGEQWSAPSRWNPLGERVGWSDNRLAKGQQGVFHGNSEEPNVN